MILTEVKLKRAIQSCRNKIKHHYEHTNHKKSNAIKNELTKIEALKKQIPKKPILDTIYLSGLEWFRCPRCNHNNIEKNDNFCHNCGQALEWSDEG